MGSMSAAKLRSRGEVSVTTSQPVNRCGLGADRALVFRSVSTVPKPVESCRFENHDIAVFLGDVFFRIERQRFFLLQVFFPVISTGVI